MSAPDPFVISPEAPAAIVAALGAGFTCQPCPYHAEHSFCVDTPEGFRFSVLGPAYGRSRHYLVSGIYGHTTFQTDNPPQARIAVWKTPERIAADIRRRFLPRFVELAQLVNERKRRNDIEVANRFTVARTVCAAFGAPFVHEVHQDPGRRIDSRHYFTAGSHPLFDGFAVQVTSTAHARLSFSGTSAQMQAIADQVAALMPAQEPSA